MTSPCYYPCNNKNVWGYCQTTGCINPLYNGELTNSGGPGKTITKGDKFRAMSDEDLAIWIDYHCGPRVDGVSWLDWLRQEAEGEV